MRLHPCSASPFRYGCVAVTLFAILSCEQLPAQEGREPPDPDQIVLDGFDKARLSLGWTAVGGIEAVREDLPESEVKGGTAPSDRGVTIKTRGKGGIYTRSARMPNNWSTFGELSFWIYRSKGEATRRQQSELEVQLLEADPKARFWRKVTVSHEGWKEIRVPLVWTRWGSGRIPRWDRIDRVGFWFRDAAELSIDTISVTQTQTARTSFVGVNHLKEVAFPITDVDDTGKARISRHDVIDIVTDVPELDAGKLARQFAVLQKSLLNDFPFFKAPSTPAVLIVFSDRDAYQQFAPNLARRLNGNAARARSSGYTILGVSHSFWDEKFGTLRPVYTHELVHSLVTRTTRLPCRGGWVHEGLASYYQLQFHPQENLPSIVQTGLRDENLRSPLKELCNGKRITGIRVSAEVGKVPGSVACTVRGLSQKRINRPGSAH